MTLRFVSHQVDVLRHLGRISTFGLPGSTSCTARGYFVTHDLACGALKTSSCAAHWTTSSGLTIVAMTFELLTRVEWLVALITSQDCLYGLIGHVGSSDVHSRCYCTVRRSCISIVGGRRSCSKKDQYEAWSCFVSFAAVSGSTIWSSPMCCSIYTKHRNRRNTYHQHHQASSSKLRRGQFITLSQPELIARTPCI